MSEPTQTCLLCGRTERVVRDGRGFPPDIAKRRLTKECKANGCPCKPQYLAGFLFGPAIKGASEPFEGYPPDSGTPTTWVEASDE